MYDVIEVCSFQRLQVSGQELIMLRDPINLINDGITEIIGSPKDFKEIKNKYADIIAKYASNYQSITTKVCHELGVDHKIVKDVVEEVSDKKENPE